MARRINLKQPTLAAAGSMEAFLNMPEIRARHNGLGADDLRQRVKFHVSKTQTMKDFNITYNTLKSYLEGLGLTGEKSNRSSA